MSNNRIGTAQDVIDFWFTEVSPEKHFANDAALDAEITARFSDTHQAAARCELASWRATPGGRLAEIIVLDQFSRNMFRDDARAFATDALSLALAQELVSGAHDSALPIEQRAFAYLPFMHSESLAIHVQAEVLFDQPGLQENLRFEHLHQQVLQRFGRYPHRNAALSRVSTAEEAAFIAQPGSRF